MFHKKKAMKRVGAKERPFLIVLGLAQDGGVPHVGTKSDAWGDFTKRRLAACLGIVDPVGHQRWMIEATPDFKEQLHRLDEAASALSNTKGILDGIGITHAHVGHYLGLASLGKEMLNANRVPLYVMSRMKEFLSENLPWRSLVEQENILLNALQPHKPCKLNQQIRLIPLPVPHRDEHSETVGFQISGPQCSVLFIPDIDRWEDWDLWGERVEEHIAAVDVAYLDGTFFDERELPGRDISKIPHPTIRSSMERFASLPVEERRKIRFIHLNHSNPAFDPDSLERQEIESAGFRVAEEGETIRL